jgi:hypothetical protein
MLARTACSRLPELRTTSRPYPDRWPRRGTAAPAPGIPAPQQASGLLQQLAAVGQARARQRDLPEELAAGAANPDSRASSRRTSSRRPRGTRRPARPCWCRRRNRPGCPFPQRLQHAQMGPAARPAAAQRQPDPLVLPEPAHGLFQERQRGRPDHAGVVAQFRALDHQPLREKYGLSRAFRCLRSGSNRTGPAADTPPPTMNACGCSR